MTTTRPPLIGIRHVALFVPDLEIAERFWVDVMGYAVEWRPDPDNVYLCGGTDNLALHGAAQLAPAPAFASTAAPARTPALTAAPATDIAQRLDHIGLAVPSPDDVDGWATHLVAHGVTLKAAPRTHRDGSRSLYFHAPDGVLVQVIHHPPISRG